MKEIGEKIRELRAVKGVTQEELASAIGVTRHAVMNYELKGAKPRRRILVEMARFFEVNEAYLADPEIEDPGYRADQAPFVEAVRDQYGNKGAREFDELLNANKALFAGGDIPQEDKDKFFQAVMEAYVLCKQKAHDKFTPKKYK